MISEITLVSQVATKAKWQLTQEAFDKLLAALMPNREAAAEQYISLRKNLVRFFEARGFSEADDAADEVLNRLARKLEGGQHLENPNSYALGIARMLALELRKSPARTSVDVMPEIGVLTFDHERDRNEQKLECLEKCLRELAPTNRNIIVGYYQGERAKKIENRQKLAGDLGIPQNALRNRAVRLRDKLESCITGCLRRAKLL